MIFSNFENMFLTTYRRTVYRWYDRNGRDLPILDEKFGFSVKFCIGIVVQDSIRRHLVPKLLPFAYDLERFYIVLTKNYTHGGPWEPPRTTMKSRIHLIFVRGCSILGSLQHIEQASNSIEHTKSSPPKAPPAFARSRQQLLLPGNSPRRDIARVRLPPVHAPSAGGWLVRPLNTLSTPVNGFRAAPDVEN